MSAYSEKLKDPRWQKKRLEILNRDQFTCIRCYDSESTLHVHHLNYEYGNNPWDYDNDNYITLCVNCHDYESNTRKDAEKVLLKQLRKIIFMADDLYQLADAIDKSVKHVPEVMISSLCHSLVSGEYIEQYFENIKGK